MRARRTQTRAKRLVGFEKGDLAPGETKRVDIAIEPRLLARFDTQANDWSLAGGSYELFAGGSSADTPLSASIALDPKRMPA